ncbi:MAG: glycosyltransferase [Eubacteriales bacterium]|nr:glycosyltransferase [Eubacteriales bacterium]
MNVLFLTLLYHPEDEQNVSRLSRVGMQNQINTYQWAFIDGIKQNFAEGETLSILNSLPVGVFPLQYRKALLKGKIHSDGIRELGCVNLPYCKQRGRAWRAEREIERWVSRSADNRTLLLYTQYLPYVQAVLAVKRRHPDVKATVIVTDLPNELGLSSGRKGLMKRIEHAMGERSLTLCRKLDGFVLLTAPMAEALALDEQYWTVIEGLVQENPLQPDDIEAPADARPAVLYTGTLNRELGIGELLEAFRGIDEAQLWLCGRGDMQAEAQKAADEYDNIHYFGFVPQKTAMALQANAAALINPRTAEGEFTRYSFPSKTMEYLRSGKPVLCCKLEGIPDEYDAYLRYISPQNALGIQAAVKALLALPAQEQAAIGERGRAFVLQEKSSRAQGEKLVRFLRKVISDRSI